MNYKYSLLIVLGILFNISLQAQTDKDIETVKSLLQNQAADWNKGDIEAFMQVYWQSDKLQFIGSKGVTYGWENTLNNYKKSYPDKAAMGELSFEIINAEKRTKKIITLIGRFHLKRTAGNLSGVFLLVWQKIKKKWVIVVDQTCG